MFDVSLLELAHLEKVRRLGDIDPRTTEFKFSVQDALDALAHGMEQKRKSAVNETNARRETMPNPLLDHQANAILLEVADLSGFTPRQIKSFRGKTELVRARWFAMAEMRRAGFSYPRIGRALCREHSTVMHGLKRFAEITEAK